MHSRSYAGAAFAAVSAVLITLLPLSAYADAVPAGLVIPVVLQNDRSDTSDALAYKVTADVKDSTGTVIIPAGSTGTGKYVQYKKSAGWGGQGKTEVSLDQITTPDGKTLTATAKKTKYGVDGRFSAIYFFGLLGYFDKGGSGKIGSGTELSFSTK